MKAKFKLKDEISAAFSLKNKKLAKFKLKDNVQATWGPGFMPEPAWYMDVEVDMNEELNMNEEFNLDGPMGAFILSDFFGEPDYFGE